MQTTKGVRIKEKGPGKGDGRKGGLGNGGRRIRLGDKGRKERGRKE